MPVYYFGDDGNPYPTADGSEGDPWDNLDTAIFNAPTGIARPVVRRAA